MLDELKDVVNLATKLQENEVLWQCLSFIYEIYIIIKHAPSDWVDYFLSLYPEVTPDSDDINIEIRFKFAIGLFHSDQKA